MPRNHPFLFLRNEASERNKFNKQRYVPQKDDEEDEATKIPRKFHKDRIRYLSRVYQIEKRRREKRRTLQVPAHFDLIKIHFLTRFNSDLQKKFYTGYGLEAVTFEDFNKTVLFRVTEVNLIEKFYEHLRLFYRSEEGASYENQEWALIALIQDFYYLASDKRRNSFSTSLSTFHLTPLLDGQMSNVYDSLVSYLTAIEKPFTRSRELTNIEVKNLTSEQAGILLDNFDVIKGMTSSRAARVRPGTYGNVIREYGFTVVPDLNNVTVGIIDTGVNRIDPLNALFTGTSHDLTHDGGAPFWDESGHGTMVAGLVALGQDFLLHRRDRYTSKAKIQVIKALHFGSDDLSVNLIADAIRQARGEGTKLFNISLNEVGHKKYNSTYSDFAYQLDRLAHELGVLLFISAGNLSDARVQELIDEAHNSHRYPFHFYAPRDPSDIHTCETTNICAPAESRNNVTVGAIADNFETNFEAGVTPAKEYPAYYTRKFHYDYDQLVNGTPFNRSQRNKFLNKPDMVFSGGDYLDREAGMEVLTSPQAEGDRFFSRNAGTSLATPLITSMAAQVAAMYPTLEMQTVKAILLNSSKMPCPENPPAFRNPSHRNLLKKLTGFGAPQQEYLVHTDENEITYVIEDAISLEDIRAIDLALPDYMANSANKLCFTATLCYSFNPLKDNHLNYCPLQIVFGFFRNVTVDELAGGKADTWKIKNGPSWSDDIWPVENRLYSNVQHRYFHLNAEKIQSVNNVITIGIKCTGKKEIDPAHRRMLEESDHKFSLVINITEVPEAHAQGRLYNEMFAINTTEAITTIELQADQEADLDAEQ